jgi:hypothetical protein
MRGDRTSVQQAEHHGDCQLAVCASELAWLGTRDSPNVRFLSVSATSGDGWTGRQIHDSVDTRQKVLKIPEFQEGSSI